MKSLYILFLLSGSVSFVQAIRLKYDLIQQGRNWSDAQAYCKATHTDLAIIEDNDHLNELLWDSQEQQFTYSAWIGLYNDINSWRWSFRNQPLGSMKMWAKREPNNSGGRQMCSAIASTGWTDKDCSNEFSVVCFDDSKSGTERYINISDVMTWHAAQSYCRQHYTDLASTLDPTEYSIVMNFFPVSWIGLFRDGWKWVDTTTFSSLSWMSKKPDNLLQHEDCGYLNNSQVGDALCSDVMPFFCYTEITRLKKTLRLKIQSNGNINDPGIKEAILDQIKHKLKDHGMAENTTVKWIQYPDGMVFHKERRIDTPQ